MANFYSTDQALLWFATHRDDIVDRASDGFISKRPLTWMQALLDGEIRGCFIVSAQQAQTQLLSALRNGRISARVDGDAIEPWWFERAEIIHYGMRDHMGFRRRRDQGRIVSVHRDGTGSEQWTEFKSPRFPVSEVREASPPLEAFSAPPFADACSLAGSETTIPLPRTALEGDNDGLPNAGPSNRGKRGLAAESIKRLYPDGIPDDEPNSIIVTKVQDELQDRLKRPKGELITIGKDTILRAAGRAK